MKKLSINIEQARELWDDYQFTEQNRLFLRKLGYAISKREWQVLSHAGSGKISWGK